MKIEIIQGDITEESSDAIVNAANNQLWMGAGVAGAIKRKGGEGIEREAIKMGPIKPGEAVVTTAGNLKTKYVVHAAGMGQDLKTSEELVKNSTASALKVADNLGLRSISFPAIGTGVGGLGLDKCATAMITAVMDFKAKSISSVRFVLFDDSAQQIFMYAYDKLNKPNK